MTKTLFDEFNPVSAKAWKQKIQVDLKGADYNNTLIWKTNQDIDVKPFYHQDDFKEFPHISDTKSTQWRIGQHINVLKADKANTEALNAIQNGAEQIIFNISSETISVEKLFKNISVPIYISTTFLSPSFIQKILADDSNTSTLPHIYFPTDIIYNLTQSGNWYHNFKEDHTQFETIIKHTKQLHVDLSLYQNAGATIIQQLAYGLAHCNEYLNHFHTILNAETKQLLTVTFNVNIGTNYFFEIAKLKALRQLWATLASEYGLNTNCTVIATPSKRNKTIYDYNVNMLRTTTECMSAVLGGANMIYSQPYNAIFQKSTEFGERISRNQLLILKHESYFNAVNNPTDGTYYIEKLTEQLSEKALILFKSIEHNGGFLKQLKEGTIQRKIKESAAKEQAQFDSGKLTLLGTNKHPDPNDKMKAVIETSPFLKIEKRKTIIEPLIAKRLAEQIEQNRLNEE